MAILKLLQQDYVDEQIVWAAIAMTARTAIAQKFAIKDIMEAETGLQFSF
jgi:hypothetical protein